MKRLSLIGYSKHPQYQQRPIINLVGDEGRETRHVYEKSGAASCLHIYAVAKPYNARSIRQRTCLDHSSLLFVHTSSSRLACCS